MSEERIVGAVPTPDPEAEAAAHLKELETQVEKLTKQSEGLTKGNKAKDKALEDQRARILELTKLDTPQVPAPPVEGASPPAEGPNVEEVVQKAAEVAAARAAEKAAEVANAILGKTFQELQPVVDGINDFRRDRDVEKAVKDFGSEAVTGVDDEVKEFRKLHPDFSYRDAVEIAVNAAKAKAGATGGVQNAPGMPVQAGTSPSRPAPNLSADELLQKAREARSEGNKLEAERLLNLAQHQQVAGVQREPSGR